MYSSKLALKLSSSKIHGILGGTGPGTGCYFAYSPLFVAIHSYSPLFSDQNVSSISHSRYFLYSVAYPYLTPLETPWLVLYKIPWALFRRSIVLLGCVIPGVGKPLGTWCGVNVFEFGGEQTPLGFEIGEFVFSYVYCSGEWNLVPNQTQLPYKSWRDWYYVKCHGLCPGSWTESPITGCLVASCGAGLRWSIALGHTHFTNSHKMHAGWGLGCTLA